MPIYFDNAATSDPKPTEVVEEVTRALTEYNANPGRSGHERALRAARAVYECRAALSDFLGARAGDTVALGYSCTDALNLGIKGVLRRGDHVISTMLEHNSVLRPLNELSVRREIALTLVAPRPDGMVHPEDVRASLRRNTALIAVTQASNVTGAIQPVAAIAQIAREHGIVCLVDGAQALGALPVDVRRIGCDLYAFPGHKSLLGPQGTGGLYIRSGLVLNTVREGGTGTDSQSMLQSIDPPERYESGTLNLPGLAGLWRGVEYVSKRRAAILSHERELTTALYEGLQSLKQTVVYSPSEEAARAALVSFNLGDMTSSEVADALSRRGIAVRGGLHCAPGAHRYLGTLRRGAVRASLGHANSFEEVDQFLAALRDILKNGE